MFFCIATSPPWLWDEEWVRFCEDAAHISCPSCLSRTCRQLDPSVAKVHHWGLHLNLIFEVESQPELEPRWLLALVQGVVGVKLPSNGRGSQNVLQCFQNILYEFNMTSRICSETFEQTLLISCILFRVY